MTDCIHHGDACPDCTVCGERKVDCPGHCPECGHDTHEWSTTLSHKPTCRHYPKHIPSPRSIP